MSSLRRRPRENLRPGAISPDAYDEAYDQERGNEIAEKVYRAAKGYTFERGTTDIGWSGR